MAGDELEDALGPNGALEVGQLEMRVLGDEPREYALVVSIVRADASRALRR